MNRASGKPLAGTVSTPKFKGFEPADLWIYLLLLVAVCGVYGQVHTHAFLNYDDPEYVTDNQHVREGLRGESVTWAFTSARGANWFPLTWLSHMLDYQLFGLDSGYHHLTNVLLHALNTLVLFALLKRMTGARWRSAFVAAVFALHPLHIESVAWIAERKDVLSGLFWFVTLWAYVSYVETPSRIRYLLVLAAFACGLMSKQMIVTLPLIALLLDFWPLKRIDVGPAWPSRLRPLVVEKLPLLALSLSASIVTYIVQRHGGAVSSFDEIPMGLRIENALISYVTYLGQLLWPANLSVFYPYQPAFSIWLVMGAVALLIAITAAVWKTRGQRYLVVGWLWYLITLVPVIGIVQVGLQSHADRYTYIPLIGLSIAVAWGTAGFLERRASGRIALAALGALVCASCAIVTWINLHYWTDSVSLFRHAIGTTSDNYIAYNNLGAALKDGQSAEAIANFEAALKIRPAFAGAESNFGDALLIDGKPGEAIPHLERALGLQPDLGEAHINLGSAFTRSGRNGEAIEQYREALRLQPENAEAHCGLGVVLNEMERPQDALDELREAVRLKPEYADAHYNLGRVLGLLGRADEAVAQFSETIRLKPRDAVAHFNLGTAFASKEQFAEAIAAFAAAVRLDPNYVNARFNLGSALASVGRLDEAIAQFREVLQRRPDFAGARQSLDYCLSLKNASKN